MSDKEKSVSCTIRMLRENVTIEESLNENHKLEKRVWSNETNKDKGENFLYIGTIYKNPPSWFDYISSVQDDLPELHNQGSAAIIFLKVEDRYLLVCFGPAQFILNLDKCERNFGLKVTLNSVSRVDIRSLDSATPDAVTIQKRYQASKNSDLGIFDIDYDRDLLTFLAGTPTDQKFAKFLAGKDSLRITCNMEAKNITKKCKKIFDLYNAKYYLKDFEWFDHMLPVKEKDIIEELDNLLYEEINNLIEGKESSLHIAPPEIVDYSDGMALHYNGFGSHGKTFYDFSIDDYIKELIECSFDSTFVDIKQKHWISYAKEGEDKFYNKWKLYKSFVYETEYDGSYYVIFAGGWYKFGKEYAQSINDFYNSIQKLDIIQKTDKRNEEELIEYLESQQINWIKLDQTKINPKNTRYAFIEPCDFYTKNKQFIHIKDGHSSAPISHLWMQGIVSAESFSQDSSFRSQVYNKIKKLKPGFEQYIDDGRRRPETNNYTIVYAIMLKPRKDRTIDLPFFSKVSLKSAVQKLNLMRYNVCINLIRKEFN